MSRPIAISTLSGINPKIPAKQTVMAESGASESARRKELTSDEVELLLCKRVLMTDYTQGKLVETHLWEMSTNKKFVKLGSASPHDDRQTAGWISIRNLNIVDILPENFYPEKVISKRIKALTEQATEHKTDKFGFLFRL